MILLSFIPGFRSVYLTEPERRVLDWHFANLEFANATELHNLSLRHWDQDDMFEMSGEHCVIQDGYGTLTDTLANLITTGQSGTSSTNTPNTKQREVQYRLGSGHIELKSSAKRISYSDSGKCWLYFVVYVYVLLRVPMPTFMDVLFIKILFV